MRLFEKAEDCAAFERVLEETYERREMRLLGYCVMPNHWHTLIWPREDGELSEVMRWLTVTHTQRWHAHYHTSGTGPVYQGRFKSFPVQSDEHFITVARYI
jgi:putative transposase